MPIGYPARDARVPTLRKKSLNEILQWNAGVKSNIRTAGWNCRRSPPAISDRAKQRIAIPE